MALVCSALVTSCRHREGFDNSDYAGLEDIPEWSGEPSVEINGNRPDFDDDEIEAAVQKTLADGYRTADIAKDGKDVIGTARCGDLILSAIEQG